MRRIANILLFLLLSIVTFAQRAPITVTTIQTIPDAFKPLKDENGNTFECGSAVVHYTFDELDPIKIEFANKQHFVHGGKGTFQNYNADQKAAIKALPESAEPNDYYLFFTDCYNRLDTAGNTSKEAVNGYIPVGCHYGFKIKGSI